MVCTPEEYPAACEVTQEELAVIKELFCDDDEELGRTVDSEWPPTDDEGNVFPIWFSPDELTDRCNLYDSNYCIYQPFSGNLEPTTYDDCGCCNAPLNNWRDRYPNIRYCGQITYDGQTFCKNHKGRVDPSDMTTINDETLDGVSSAEELMQTGLFTQTIDHFYSNLDPLKKLAGWGMFESLMGESSYEFGVEYEPRKFDFSDSTVRPDGVDDDGYVTVKCGFPTQHIDPALSLYVAAMMGVQMATIQPRIMSENEDEGERMMESKTIEHAQLTAPTENSPDQDYKTLETWSEHHLNLPLSRLVTDRPKLLERGGIGVDGDESADTIDEDDVILEVQADPDEVDTAEGGTDPNAFDGNMAPSEEIAEKASDG